MDTPPLKVFAPAALLALVASAAVALLSGAPARAQTIGAAPQPIQFIVAPEAPGPNENVYIEAQGVGSFLGNSPITWSVNGKAAASGVGLRTFSLRVGPIGTQTTVVFRAQTQDYGTITHTFAFNPSLVELLWEADTSAPPFYRGKPLPSAGASVRVVAFPVAKIGGASVSADRLSFQWRLNGVLAADASGVGRETYALSINELHANEQVSVDVLSGSQKIGHGEVVVPAAQPQILFYAHDPLRGLLYNRALGASFAMPNQELTVKAEPYFFSLQSIARGALAYDWTLAGQRASGPRSAAGELTVRQTGSGAGSADLSVALQNSDTERLLQEAQATLHLTFGASQNQEILGL